MITINYVTTNSHKVAVAQHFLRSTGLDQINVHQVVLETPEIQADSVIDVAKASAVWAGKQLDTVVVVADAGLAITALRGFPGPYLKYVNQTLTVEDLLALMASKPDRTATFTDCLAYHDPHTGYSDTFISATPGIIADRTSLNTGTPLDQLFIPQGWSVPLADLTPDERAQVWNMERWHALIAFLQNK